MTVVRDNLPTSVPKGFGACLSCWSPANNHYRLISCRNFFWAWTIFEPVPAFVRHTPLGLDSNFAPIFDTDLVLVQRVKAGKVLPLKYKGVNQLFREFFHFLSQQGKKIKPWFFRNSFSFSKNSYSRLFLNISRKKLEAKKLKLKKPQANFPKKTQ